MEDLGPYPSSTGEPDGKRTGQRVSHYIVAGAPFAQACAAFLDAGYDLRYGDIEGDSEAQKKKAASRSSIPARLAI